MNQQKQLELKARLFDHLISFYTPSEIDVSDLSEVLGKAISQACHLGYFDASILIDSLKRQGDEVAKTL